MQFPKDKPKENSATIDAKKDPSTHPEPAKSGSVPADSQTKKSTEPPLKPTSNK